MGNNPTCAAQGIAGRHVIVIVTDDFGTQIDANVNVWIED